MRCVFDARWIFEKPSGIGVYARELMKRLPWILPDWEFVFVFSSEAMMRRVMEETACGHFENARGVVFPHEPLSWQSQLLMPFFLRRLRADVFHSPNYMMPYLAFPLTHRQRMKGVVTVHDVIPLVVEDYAPNSRTSRMKNIFRFCLRQCVLRADAVATVSRASKRDLVHVLNLSGPMIDRIKVVYNGAVARGQRDVYVAKRDSATERILLYVGRMDPYKNVTGLVKAFNMARGRVRFPVRLVIAGAEDERYPAARQIAAALSIEDKVTFTGFLSDAELAQLYATADLLVHPSLYEGFGLQILEAMQIGLPVCCTDGGSQPEIASGAGYIVPAGNNAFMADAIARLLNSPDELENMSCAGIAHAERFTWERTADGIAEIYRDVVAHGKR